MSTSCLGHSWRINLWTTLWKLIAEEKTRLQEGGIPSVPFSLRDGQVLGRGHNKRVQDGDPVTHAEIDCLRNAGRIGKYKDTTSIPP